MSIGNIVWTKWLRNLYVQCNVIEMGVSFVVVKFNEWLCIYSFRKLPVEAFKNIM